MLSSEQNLPWVTGLFLSPLIWAFMVQLFLATTRKYLTFLGNQRGRAGYVENHGNCSFANSEEHIYVKTMQFPELWRNIRVVEILWGQHPSSQGMGIYQGSKGLQVHSAALSWSCSPWDGQAARWVAKLVPCPGWEELQGLLCVHIPINLSLTSQLYSPSTMSSCCPGTASPTPAALSRFMWNSTFPLSECAFLSHFSLPRITWRILDSVSPKIWWECISLNSHIKDVNIQRNCIFHPPHLFPLLILGLLAYYHDATFIWPLLDMSSAMLETLNSI